MSPPRCSTLTSDRGAGLGQALSGPVVRVQTAALPLAPCLPDLSAGLRFAARPCHSAQRESCAGSLSSQPSRRDSLLRAATVITCRASVAASTGTRRRPSAAPSNARPSGVAPRISDRCVDGGVPRRERSRGCAPGDVRLASVAGGGQRSRRASCRRRRDEARGPAGCRSLRRSTPCGGRTSRCACPSRRTGGARPSSPRRCRTSSRPVGSPSPSRPTGRSRYASFHALSCVAPREPLGYVRAYALFPSDSSNRARKWSCVGCR